MEVIYLYNNHHLHVLQSSCLLIVLKYLLVVSENLKIKTTEKLLNVGAKSKDILRAVS
jgi:hypothetical protein